MTQQAIHEPVRDLHPQVDQGKPRARANSLDAQRDADKAFAPVSALGAFSLGAASSAHVVDLVRTTLLAVGSERLHHSLNELRPDDDMRDKAATVAERMQLEAEAEKAYSRKGRSGQPSALCFFRLRNVRGVLH